ncbi:MAG: bifunctional phosphoribosylaminoimidazolecarboxamide formyltransferase/IMP cyclohydrolase [Thermoplasmatota archaeon]
MRKISTALLSVSDKTGLASFAQRLSARGIQLLSTGGTARALREAGLAPRDVADVTGFPEIMDGRVKTLHPRILGGILAVRENPQHQGEMAQHGLSPIDIVCVNLYPFEETVGRAATREEIIENIDIGGPSLIRAAAKNWQDVIVLTRPDQYEAVISELEKTGDIDDNQRQRLAAEAFAMTARYDVIIDQYFRHQVLREDLPEILNLSFRKIQNLRYGENSHQRAAFYTGKPTKEPAVVNAKQLHGKELSYNNILDVDCALEAVKDFDRPSCTIIKHATPCGIASADTLEQAFDWAYDTDTYSPYGGIVALNRRVDMGTAAKLGKLFLEAVCAPAYDPEALAHLKQKKNIRLLEIPHLDHRGRWGGLQYRSVVGGLVVQDRDILEPRVHEWKVATKAQPTSLELRTMLFAFKAVRHVRSNSVVFAKDERTVAIGGGQTARVDATRIAILKGGDRIRGSVMASEAFFPFPDAVSEAANAGVVGIVQPGGSIRDGEVIAEADKSGISMVFTGQRGFRH